MIVPGVDSRTGRFLRGAIYLWIAVLVLALDPRTEDPATPIKHLASAVAAVGLVAVWAMALRMNRVPYRNMSHGLSCLLLFFGVLLVSAAVSDASYRGIQTLAPWLVFSAIGFVAYQTFPHTRHLRNLMRVIVACVALSSVYGLAQHFGWDPFPWAMRDVEEYRALPATYGNPNLAGHALVVALALCAGLLADAWQSKRPLGFAVYLVPGAVIAAHLGFTQMRSGPVALGVALAFVAITLFLLRRTKKRPWQAAGVALSACMGLFFIIAIAVLALAPGLNLDSSLQLRLNGYAGAAVLFLENPIFGVGPGSYAFYNIPHWSSFEALWYALEHKRNFHAHNEWLEMAAECGIPGLAALIGLFLFSIITFFENPWMVAEKHWGLLLALPAAMVALATDACFGFNLHAPVSAGLFFLLLALRPARPDYSAPTRKSARRATVPLCVVTLAAAWWLWSDYGHERQYQRCVGAVDWERGQHDSGTSVEDLENVSNLLESLTESRPLDYRGWMLRGDHALMLREAKQAADAYGRALWVHPYLPRLHVQRARALILQAQQENVESAVTLANKHGGIALALCPELAEAHAMLGWAAYVKMSYPALEPSDADLRDAVERFNRARALGLVDDARIDGALAECHGRLGAWEEAADACQRYVAAWPYELERWVRWREAATRAGGAALVQYRQTLLRHFAPSSEGKMPNSPELTVWLASQIAALSKSPAQVSVAERALSDAVNAKAALTGVWSASLGLTPEELRAETLARMISSIPESRRADISPTIKALNDALIAPHADSLTTAATALVRELATAPGTEDFERASVHAPLVAMLGDALRDSGLPGASLGPALQALGAAQFETGDLRGADENLRAAETALPAGELAQAWYYHARTLAPMGQHEAALTMAKAAQDGEGGVVEYQWQLARCLAAGGHAEAARFAFESLLGTLAPDHPYRALVERDRQALAVRETPP